MKKFNELNINVDENRFVGKKIGLDAIVGQTIQVEKFVIEPSNYSRNGPVNRSKLQIRFNDELRITFTNSAILRETLERVSKVDGFPFETKIEGNRFDGYRFT